MEGQILIAVEDLIFLSKIRETAQRLGVKIEVVDIAQLGSRIQQSHARAVVLDLNHRSGRAVEIVRTIKADPQSSGIPLLGFLSHVQTELAASARGAGCDQVLARSTFSQQLRELLSGLANVK